MRFISAFAGALLITVAVFLFMQGLIENRRKADVQLLVHQPIAVTRDRPKQQEPEKPPREDLQEPQPAMAELQLPVLSPQPKIELEIPALDLAAGNLEIAGSGDRWSAPLGSDIVGILEGRGVGAEGFVEIVPNATRKPNVPELAWKNKINGWVLVAFNVMPDGRTRNIRVLDANPRGVFEEKVVAAVEDWLYSVKFSGKRQGEVVLTQKVEVEWKNYHMNMPNVD